MEDARSCAGCGGAREIESSEWGVTKYKSCTACGAIGILRPGDPYQAPQLKKALRLPYDRSPYRGGKLRVT